MSFLEGTFFVVGLKRTSQKHVPVWVHVDPILINPSILVGLSLVLVGNQTAFGGVQTTPQKHKQGLKFIWGQTNTLNFPRLELEPPAKIYIFFAWVVENQGVPKKDKREKKRKKKKQGSKMIGGPRIPDPSRRLKKTCSATLRAMWFPCRTPVRRSSSDCRRTRAPTSRIHSTWRSGARRRVSDFGVRPMNFNPSEAIGGVSLGGMWGSIWRGTIPVLRNWG